jgi:succinate-acetate transporter protein
MITAVNAAQGVLAQVGNEGDSPNTVPSVVTTTQLASVPGVIGVVPANQGAYQAYIDANPLLFSSPATVAEVNAMIAAVNASQTVLAQVGNEGDSPNTVPSVVTTTQLASVSGVTGVVPANQAAYQAYIDANPSLFSAPATVAEVNAMITAVNAAQGVLAQVGNEGDSPNTVPSVVTTTQLASVPGVTGVVPANQAAYQAYIDANPSLFSSPATVAEVNAMITAVNAAQGVLAQVGNEGDSPNTVPSVVTTTQLASVPGVTGVVPANQAAYQAYIDANPSLFSAPATVAEVNAMITAVNAAQGVLAQVGNEGDSPNTVPSVVTTTQLASVPGVTGVVPANQAAYQAYIDANPSLFSAPATVAEVNAMIAAVNAAQTALAQSVLAQVGNEGDSPNTVPSVVTTTQLASVPGVTGVVPANQAAYQAYIDANPSLFSEPATVAEVNAMITIVNNSVPQTITSTTGKIWMDRNLGATQVATSLTDHLAYGDLYQWGRKKDGHEKITWTNGTTGTAVNGTTFTRADIPANSLFIMHFAFPSDWRVNENSFLWDGVAAVNNPCPAGFRVPTTAEINAEVSAYGITNAATAFSSPFKFTVQGWRAGSDGVLGNAGSSGNYWSSSVSSNLIPYRTFGSDNTSVVNGTRTTGLAVRCIKN